MISKTVMRVNYLMYCYHGVDRSCQDDHHGVDHSCQDDHHGRRCRNHDDVTMQSSGDSQDLLENRQA